MIEAIQNKPFLVAVFAGAIAQIVKVLSFLLVEKRVNYKRFVQADGSPNLHAATFSALGMAVGFKDGFDSIVFMLALCITVLICIDTLNVKNAASRQAEVVYAIVERIIKKKSYNLKKREQGHSYTPVDVLTGLAVGIVFTVLVF